MRSQRGMTLVEMLVLMATPAAALGGGRQTSPLQPASIFQLGTADNSMHLASGQACTVGIDDATKQPPVIVASPSRFGFEAECVSDAPTDKLASYIPFVSAPTDSADIAADTAVFFFQPDLATARTDDYVLMRQMNRERPTALQHNVLAYPGRPFFQYYYRKLIEGGKLSTQPVPNSWLPLRHGAVKHGTPADTGSAARVDTLRAVEVSYTVSNGRAGADERVRRVSTIVPLATLSRKRSHDCEREPFASQVSNMMPMLELGRKNSVFAVPAAPRRTCTIA